MTLTHPQTGETMLLDPKKIEMPRSPNNYDARKASDDTGLTCEDPTLTQQQFAEESDINYIAERFGLTGELPQVLELPKYGDFTGIFDFQTAQNSVIHAQKQFMTLPAKMRQRFNDDPQKLLAFLEDPANRDEAIFLGLVNKPQEAPQSPTGDAGAKPAPATPSGTTAAPANPTT